MTPIGESPEVVVDFTFDRGLLHVAVANVSDLSATGVSVAFDEPFRGLGGEVEVSSLALFRRVEFLAPRKRIETFLDSSAAYFERREPTTIAATITYSDAAGIAYERRVVHDLAIYRDVSYVVTPPGAATAGVPPQGTPPHASARPTLATGSVRHGRPQG